MDEGLHVYVTSVIPQGTVSLGVGTDDDGRKVIFAGDWRPMQHIYEAIARGDDWVEVDVPPWAVLVHNTDPS